MDAPLNNSLGCSGERHEDKEKQLIFKALYEFKQPLTRRKLSEITFLELPTLCRSLYNLVHKRKLLTVAKIAPCAKTGKRVYHYYFALNSKEGIQND
jgi:hypothetical protein